MRKPAALLVTILAAWPSVAWSASIEASRGAVAAEHRLASMAGVEILQRGGNAVDAAVAAALATGVVNPSSSGIGGGGFLVSWDARRKRAATIDFRETAPRAATETMFVRSDGTVDANASKTGPLAVGVPGELAGLELALERHGRLRFADVAAPAIRIAREGFAIEAHLASMIAAGQGRLAADAGLARVFLHEDGTAKREGEKLVRPDLAATLERIAAAGVRDFYEGEIAADIARTVATWHGRAVPGADGSGSPAPLDAKDLREYRAIEREPLRTSYRGRDIFSMAPPSSGGAVLDEALGVLAAWDLSKVEPQGPTWAHALAETMKATFADRAVFYGDPAFTRIPMDRLLGAAHADQIRARVAWSRAVPSAELAPPVDAGRDSGTSHISVIDADGNAAALTTSVNTGFGAGVSVPGRDIVLNNTMSDFSAQPGKPNAFGLVGSKANAIAAGKRPLSSMTPVIVLENGRVRLVAGGSGGPLIITSTLATVLGVVDFGMSADAAVSAPRIHHQWLPDVVMAEAGIPEKTVRALTRVGHKVIPMPAKASVQAVEQLTADGARKLVATSDPRKGGVPAGY